MANWADIRRQERMRLATLIEASAECLVDFTGGSTLATVGMIVYLLRLDHSDEAADITEPPGEEGHSCRWCPHDETGVGLG